MEFEASADSSIGETYVVGDTLFATINGEREGFALETIDAVWVEEMYKDWIATGMLAAVVGAIAVMTVGFLIFASSGGL